MQAQCHFVPGQCATKLEKFEVKIANPTAGRADRTDAAFERGDAFFQYGHGRIRNTAVDVSGAFEIEQRRGLVRVAEDERRCLINRLCPRDGLLAFVPFLHSRYVICKKSPIMVSKRDRWAWKLGRGGQEIR